MSVMYLHVIILDSCQVSSGWKSVLCGKSLT